MQYSSSEGAPRGQSRGGFDSGYRSTRGEGSFRRTAPPRRPFRPDGLPDFITVDPAESVQGNLTHSRLGYANASTQTEGEISLLSSHIEPALRPRRAFSQVVRSSSRAVRRSAIRPLSLALDAMAAQFQEQDRSSFGDALDTEHDQPSRTLSQALRSTSRAARYSVMEPISRALDLFSSQPTPEPGRNPIDDPLGAWTPVPVPVRPVWAPSTARPPTPIIPEPLSVRVREAISEFFTLPVGSVTELIPPIYYHPPPRPETRSRRVARELKERVKKAGKMGKGALMRLMREE